MNAPCAVSIHFLPHPGRRWHGIAARCAGGGPSDGDPGPRGRGGRRHGFGGGGFGGGPGGRGGRIFGQGDLRLVVLQLIADAPRHGYDLIKAIEAMFGGQYAPSPGAIYPTLTLLEEQDYLVPEAGSDGGKKRYRITDAGRAHLAENQAVVDGVMARLRLAARAMAGDAPPEAVVQAMQTLKHALLFRRGRWTPVAVEQAARLIQSAADAIARGDADGPAA